ncbi:E3 ubiquitin-protein ligase RNF31 isoform X3 [Channa argus]|uniref:E3 ubiquitin-protein ligase RNF31 isoform X3 n=1 Tax=Channa argus TaxID=215402 RepID=UPI003522EF5A
MPRVGVEEELGTLAECGYSHPTETLSDLQQVRYLFSDLRLYVDFYCFPNKDKKKLVYLAGTVPVQYEDVAGNIGLNGLRNWTQGISNLSLLVSEMRKAFEKDTPLYAKCPGEVPLPAVVQVNPPATGGSLHLPSVSSSSSSNLSAASQWEHTSQVKVRRSYTEELLGIDFSVSSNYNKPFQSSSSSVPGADPLSKIMGALRLNKEYNRDQQGDSTLQVIKSEAARDRYQTGSVPAPEVNENLGFKRLHSDPAAGADYTKMAVLLPPDQSAMFLSLMTMEGRSFSPGDVMEAVQLNRDFLSALRFLTHSCPICQDQVTFSKIITMTHCSCFMCQTCFKMFFLAAIKERSIEQMVCPQCGRPEIKGQKGMEESMDYFNLLDTQIRHFLPPDVHELFQRKLRDRALQEMPNFCWCAHCSFGMLHEAERLRMDCPSCKKSTCSQCRSPWAPQHQGLTCEQFRHWQQQNQPDHHHTALLSYNSIECPNCQFVFSLSKGGCLHFTCSQCQHQFCGGCSQAFTLGSACGFSAECGTKGLHAHHPRDCLYHLRDWSVSRLHLLLQYYRVTLPWLESAGVKSPETRPETGVCLVLELRDDGSRREEACGQPALPEYRGFCQSHYKERLVELINRCHADPVVLFNMAEMTAELRRWYIAVPTRKPDEPDPLYSHRLRLVLTNSVPLRKQRQSPLKSINNLCPLTSVVAAGAPPPHLLLKD